MTPLNFSPVWHKEKDEGCFQARKGNCRLIGNNRELAGGWENPKRILDVDRKRKGKGRRRKEQGERVGCFEGHKNISKNQQTKQKVSMNYYIFKSVQ